MRFNFLGPDHSGSVFKLNPLVSSARSSFHFLWLHENKHLVHINTFHLCQSLCEDRTCKNESLEIKITFGLLKLKKNQGVKCFWANVKMIWLAHIKPICSFREISSLKMRQLKTRQLWFIHSFIWLQSDLVHRLWSPQTHTGADVNSFALRSSPCCSPRHASFLASGLAKTAENKILDIE